MNYVLVVDGAPAGQGRLELEDGRSAPAMAAFKKEIRTLLDECRADVVHIKAKPESGQMRAGAASLKMEAVLLAEAEIEVVFVSAQAAAKIEKHPGLYAYQQPAWQAAMAKDSKKK